MAKLTLQVRPWQNTQQAADPADANGMLIESLLVDGLPIDYSHAQIHWDGPIDFMTLTLMDVTPEQRGRFAPDECLLGSSASTLMLPVSGIELEVL